MLALASHPSRPYGPRNQRCGQNCGLLTVDTRCQYSDDTANLFAKKLLDGATAETRIAVVSTPSVFVALKNILVRTFSQVPDRKDESPRMVHN